MIYRFRDISKLINEPYEELQKQYFYFASPDTLNDPSEGYVDFYWYGDQIAWLGLFKNYVWQLYFAFLRIMIGQDDDEIKRMYFWKSEIHVKDTPISETRVALEKGFSEEPLIKDVANILANSKVEVRPSTLQFILGKIHIFAIKHANDMIEKIVGEPLFLLENIKELEFVTSEQGKKYICESIEKIIQKNDKSERVQWLSNLNSNMRVYLENGNSESLDVQSYLAINFPVEYTNQVVSLSYAKWQVVCFNRSYKDPRMWSHYADHHRGVCLMFDYELNDKVKLEALENNDDTKRELSIKSIDYGMPPVKTNFFSTLGNLWGDERKHWLFDSDKMSVILEDIFQDEDKWRENYWKLYEKRFLRKGLSWASEEEVRIVLDDWFYDHSSSEKKKYKYDFNKLHGVIFGVHTQLSDKIKIINILTEKCEQNNRHDLYIYQALYDDKRENIKKELLMIINEQ